MEKDSFIIYKSFYEPIRSLSDRQLGRLFRALFDYQINASTNVDNDIQMAFAFFKNQMDIDNSKYQKVVERNRQNGLKGGRPNKEENPKNPVGLKKPKKADNDNDNDNDYLRFINKSFVSIENLDERYHEFKGDKRFLFIAKIFWEMWHTENPNSKTLKEARIGKWTDDVRKIVEVDKTSFERIIGIYCYFVKCSKHEVGFDDFWFKTVKSMAAFRKKSKDGVYYIDHIIDKVNDKREKDKDFLRYVDGAITKFNQNSKLK